MGKKTYASRYADERDKNLNRKNDDDENHVLKALRSYTKEEIQKKVEEFKNRPKRKKDPTGRAIYAKVLAKMQVSQPQDAEEVQADKVAEGVMKGDTANVQLSQKETNHLSASKLSDFSRETNLYQDKKFYYVDRENNLQLSPEELDEETLLKEGFRDLRDIIPSEKLRNDFILGFMKSKKIRQLVKQANLRSINVETSKTETSATPQFDENNKYAGSKIRIIEADNTTDNVRKFAQELTNTKNHEALISLDNKAINKEIDKKGFIEGVIRVEAEAAFNQKLVVKQANGLIKFKGLEKYDNMTAIELEANVNNFIEDYCKQDFKSINIEGQKVSVWDKYSKQYDELTKPTKSKGK